MTIHAVKTVDQGIYTARCGEQMSDLEIAGGFLSSSMTDVREGVTCPSCINTMGEDKPVVPSNLTAGIDPYVLNEETRVHLEDGDILFVKVLGTVSRPQLQEFREALAEKVLKDLDVKASVVVVAGDVTMGVVKGLQLDDILTRLKSLEEKVGA